MKKHLILIFAVLLVISALFTSCDFNKKDPEPEPHECVAGTWVIASYPTDVTEGVKHKVCTECGNILLKEAFPSSEGLAYQLYNDSFYSVTGVGTCKDTDIVIPSTYNGLPVASIKNGAFNGYTAVGSITLGDRLVTIEANAFRNCTSLSKVQFSDSLAYVEDGAFAGCSFLQDVYYNSDLEDWLNINFLGTTANPLCNGTNLYINNKLATDIVIPNTIANIPAYSFINCKSLTSLDIPDTVRRINDYAFANCANLANVQLGNQSNSIGNYAFSNCVNLVEVVIPDNVRTLGNYAFHKCTSLEKFTFGDKLSTVGEYTFAECTSLRTLNLCDAIVKINNYAFNNCQSLEFIYYEGTADNWAMINFTDKSSNPMHLNKAKAYFGGQLVKNIVIEKATKVNAYAFYMCSSLESVVLGDSVTYVNNYAFQACPVLESATLNCNIGYGAFADCPYFESINLGVNVKSIGGYAFSNDTYLDKLTYAGTEAEWEAVSKAGGWNNKVSSYFEVTCTGVEPEIDPVTPADAE